MSLTGYRSEKEWTLSCAVSSALTEEVRSLHSQRCRRGEQRRKTRAMRHRKHTHSTHRHESKTPAHQTTCQRRRHRGCAAQSRRTTELRNRMSGRSSARERWERHGRRKRREIENTRSVTVAWDAAQRSVPRNAIIDCVSSGFTHLPFSEGHP